LFSCANATAAVIVIVTAPLRKIILPPATAAQAKDKYMSAPPDSPILLLAFNPS